MRRAAELAVFLALATGLHLAAAAWAARLPDPAGAEAGGSGGAALLSLQGATAQVESMVARWQTPPEAIATPRTAALAAPPSPAEPPMPAARVPEPPPARPGGAAALAGSAPLAPPKVETGPAAPPPPPAPEPRPEAEPERAPAPGPAASTKPKPRPAPPPRPAETGEESRPARAAAASRQAAGGGGGGHAGQTRQAPAATLSRGQAQRLVAAWGAQIRARVAARVRAPRDASGTVVLRLTVLPDGRVARAAIARSSGNRAVDQAASRALSRAGRMPRAPGGLTDASYSFNLPVQVK